MDNITHAIENAIYSYYIYADSPNPLKAWEDWERLHNLQGAPDEIIQVIRKCAEYVRYTLCGTYEDYLEWINRLNPDYCSSSTLVGEIKQSEADNVATFTNRKWLESLNDTYLSQWLTNTYVTTNITASQKELIHTGIDDIRDKYSPSALGVRVWLGQEHK